jgi:hypothetical protein
LGLGKRSANKRCRTGGERVDVSNGDLPEVRVRQPAFGAVTEQAGLTSFDSMMDTFGVDLDEVRAAVFGAPVSPGFVASVLATFPEHSFRELFHLDVKPAADEVRVAEHGVTNRANHMWNVTGLD